MKLGIALPTSGALASPEAIARVAVEAERLGYASLWTYERLLRPVDGVLTPDGSRQPLPEVYRRTYEPLETLSYVAALTSRVTLGTSVIDALLHPPVVLARRFATLDRFSGGRVVAGLGQGWMREEFDVVGVPIDRIGAGLDDTVAAMRACWGPDPVAHEGRYHRIPPSEIGPKPAQEHLPVLIGAMTPRGVARAARIADGINPIATSFDLLAGLTEAFRSAAREQGRDADALPVVVRANVPLTTDPLDGERPFLGGSPAQVVEDLKRVADLGIDHVMLSDNDADDLDERLRLLDRLVTAAAR